MKILKYDDANTTFAIGIAKDENIDALLVDGKWRIRSAIYRKHMTLIFNKECQEHRTSIYGNTGLARYEEGDIVKVELCEFKHLRTSGTESVRYFRYKRCDSMYWKTKMVESNCEYRLCVYVAFSGPGIVQIELL